jgi:hypothetical protein
MSIPEQCNKLLSGYTSASCGHHKQEAHRKTTKIKTTGAKQLVKLVRGLQQAHWREPGNDRHELPTETIEGQGTQARQDWQAKVAGLNQHKVQILVSDQRIFQKELPARLLEFTQQLHQWYDTTQAIIEYMKKEARSIKESSMRDIRTYFSKIIEPDNSLQKQTRTHITTRTGGTHA